MSEPTDARLNARLLKTAELLTSEFVDISWRYLVLSLVTEESQKQQCKPTSHVVCYAAQLAQL